MLERIEKIVKKHSVERMRISTRDNNVDIHVKGEITDELRVDLQDFIVGERGLKLSISPMSESDYDEVDRWKSIRLNDPAWRKLIGLEDK